MKVVESSIARLMLLVPVIAVGSVTLKSQSEFWLGALVASWALT